MMLDGLEDAYEPGRAMGTFGEDCAAKYLFTREQQDHFAIVSAQRALAATASGAFAAEIAPVTVKGRGGETVVATDEAPTKVKLDKIATMKPAFKKDGTITAASSSSISDGGGRPGADAGVGGGPRKGCSPWRVSSATRCMHRSRTGSRPRRWGRSARR